MFVPPGYLNFQLLFRGPNNRPALTAVGFVAEAVSTDDVAQANDAFGLSEFWENMDDSWVLTGSRAIIGTSDPSAPIVYEVSSTLAGGNSGTSAPPNCALLLRKVTNRGGRKGRGRMYVPGIPADYLTDGGSLGGATTTLQTQLRAALDDMQEALEAPDAVLLHADEADGDPNVITEFVLDGTIATQRRRLRK